MAPLRLTTCCCLTVFLMTSWLSHARVHRGIEVEAVSARKGVLEVFDGEHFDSAAVTIDKTQGGRKLTVVKPEKMKVGDANIERTSISSGSTLYDGKCGNQAKKLKSAANCNKKNNVRNVSEDVDEKEFVAFNADYRAPRHHPPKNN